MLNRNITGAAVTAILFLAALSNSTLGQPFANGDFFAYTQADWGSPGVFAAELLDDNFTTVYALRPLRVGGGFSMLFTEDQAVYDYLPAAGAPGPLNSSLLDPLTSSSGVFGGDAVALQLNIDFSDAGLTLGMLGVPFGDFKLHSMTALPELNGLTVRQFNGEVNNLLGGRSGIYSIAELRPVADELNRSYNGGIVSQWAQAHLRVGPYFADGDFITHPQSSWGESPTPTNAAGLLLANYDTVYAPTSGLLELGIPGPFEYSIVFNNPASVLDYLPASGQIGPFLSDALNPLTTTAGQFGGEVAALTLNVDFADAGVTLGNRGISFGDLVLYGTQSSHDGLTVREFLDSASLRLSYFYPSQDIAQCNLIAEQLNASFAAAGVTLWARNHLLVPAIPGDYNDDGTVDAADYVVWRKGLGTIYTQSDFNTWRTNFGQTFGSGSVAAANATVPEPTTLVLLMLATVGSYLWRGRATKKVPTTQQTSDTSQQWTPFLIHTYSVEKSSVFSD